MNRTASSTLMTEGSIWKKIVTFAFPLFLGNLFQQLYNTADSLIVGNFLGSDALAAVSSSGSLIFLMVGFFNGIAMGAGVVVARYYGARQTDRLQRAIHTDVAFGIVAGILLTIIGLILAPQFISALLCLRRLLRSPEEYRLVPSRIRFDPIMLKQIISNGLPAGLQNSIIALANVVVQSNINSFGKMAVAGCGAYSKVEGFGFLPITCFSLALTTFISQNLGAKQYDRAKRGARFGILCSITLAEIVGICVYFLSPYLIAAFNSDPEVVAYGTLQAHTITLFYFLLAFSHCIAGIMRGAGKATVPMFVMLCCWCIIRVTYITIAVRIFPVINTIFWAYPLTWTLSSILFFLYYRKADWIHGFEKK